MLRKMLKQLLYIPAHLPLGLLYVLSDAAAVILHRVARYRLSTVRGNLRACFPDMSPGELRDIERQFYRNFADSFVETLKLLHISDAEMKRRMEFEGIGIIDRLQAEGRSIAVYFAHFFNWEWAPSVSLYTALKPSAETVFGQVYRPLRSQNFDRLMLSLRSRFNSVCYPKASTLRHLVLASRKGIKTITGFMSDQHPSHGDRGYRTTLLGRPTMMITGTETLARKLGMAAIYWDMEKISRGRYKITVRMLAEHPSDLPEGELTERYTRALEQTVKRNPAIWLWSHKRWKYPVSDETEQ